MVVHLGAKLVLPQLYCVTAALTPSEDDERQLSPFFVYCSLGTRSLQGLGSSHSLKFSQTLAIFLVEALPVWEPETLDLQVAEIYPGG